MRVQLYKKIDEYKLHLGVYTIGFSDFEELINFINGEGYIFTSENKERFINGKGFI